MQEGQINPEIARFFEPMTEVINGVNVTFFGADHRPGFFEQNRDKLTQVVQGSQKVVVETFSPDLTTSDHVAGALGFFAPGAVEFFDKVAGLASDHPGKITVIDPYSAKLSALHLGLLAAIYAPPTIRVTLAASKPPAEGDSPAPIRITRRGLIKGGLALAASYSLMGTEDPGELFNYVSGREKDTYTHGIDDTLAYSTINYRNILLAYALDKLTQTSAQTNISSLAFIYGAAHPHNILAYQTANNAEFKIKKALYEHGPFALFGRETIRDYRYDGAKWQKISDTAY